MTQHNPHHVPDDPNVFVPVSVRAWQDGYDAGVSSPPDVPPTPLVRDPDYADAWAEGALAGNADGRAEYWRWAYFTTGRPEEGRPDHHAHWYTPRDSGVPERQGRAALPRSWPCVGDKPLRVMLTRFAPEAPFREGLTGRSLARACEQKNVERLYMPVALSASAPVGASGDPLRDNGYEHGEVTASEDEAMDVLAGLTDATVRFPGLIRYTPAAEHDFFELLPVGGELPAERPTRGSGTASGA
ncbi:hypothetical protein [Streptomyces sp. NPDC005476]|uniref:hypothetical protein n=1 Tax=Streptomyces sp. NPDC005476 TaxID=3156882 RepID=UPI003454C55C